MKIIIIRLHLMVVLSLITSWSSGLCPNEAMAVEDPFPLYPCIESNVNFWVKVYAEEPSTRGFIHDSMDLDIIYDVIDVKSQDEPGANEINRILVDAAKNKYMRILHKLASGGSADTAEEKRVLALFGPKPKLSELRAAENNVRFQRGQKDCFKAGLIRSGAYLGKIKNILNSYGLPADLAYLPHVESSFNYEAYSKFGAAGVWQFTRSTGKRFLTIDYTLDERRDPISATHAAAKLLKENYKALGSWPLALTAYNHGTAGVCRAKQAMGGYERIFREYESESFKFASRNFYSEFLAARKVAKNFVSYLGPLKLEQPMETMEVKLPGYASIHDLADHFDIDVATIKMLNPAIRNPVYRGQKLVPKGYGLRLPAGKGPETKQLAAVMPKDFLQSQQKRSRFYTVRKGDTIGEIAKLHDIKLKDLILVNQLDKNHAIIYPGQNLRIPGSSEEIGQLAMLENNKTPSKQKADPSMKADSGQTGKQKTENRPSPASTTVPELSVSKQKVAVATSVSPSKGGASESGGHSRSGQPEQQAAAQIAPQSSTNVSSSGQSLSVPATEPAVSDNDNTNAEQAVVRPPAAGPREPDQDATAGTVAIASKPGAPAVLEPEVNPAVVSGNLHVEKVVNQGSRAVGIIKVAVGETLSHYAEWVGVEIQEIRRMNKLGLKRGIVMDQSIKIPLHKVSVEDFEEKRYEYHKEVEEDFFSSYSVQGVRIYEIKKGDNIWSLCQAEFEMPFWLIKKYNPALDFNGLMPAQKIQIPVVEEARES